jgi:hypothetical protein
MRKIETFPWWSDLLKLKDDYSLRELADRFDVTPGAITSAFKRTGTARKAAPPGPRSRRAPRQEALPPEPGEVVVAAPADGASGRPGSKDERIAALRDQLGSVPDAAVASRAGVSVRTVAAYRARHGIPGYSGPRRRGADKQPRKSRIDSFSSLVGTVPDRVVAERAGVSVNAVRNWRVKRGVSARSRSAEAPAPAPAKRAPAPPAPAVVAAESGRAAWRVTYPATVRVVVADGIAAAAALAEAAGLGPVRSMEWVGDLL